MEKELNTYKHWVSLHLDKDNAERFFTNMVSEDNPVDSSGEVPEEEFITSAFVWERSKEGHDYWMNVQSKLEEENGWVTF